MTMLLTASVFGAAALGILGARHACAQEPPAPPHVILVMADDLGWGDLGFQGSESVHTPHLDALAGSGVILSRFYSASPVCSPTRASMLTARSPLRMGITGANSGSLPHAEWTLAELMREAGYRTGFFGKWHLGTLTFDVQDSNRGGRRGNARYYSPPREHGFDESFATEAKVPTFDPMRKPHSDLPYGTRYWDTEGVEVTENLEGDDSRVVMDRVLPFVDRALDANDPFFATIWFHSPHLPVVASPRAKRRYAAASPEAQAYRGSITDLDQQVGRLAAHLRERGAWDNTLLIFCSDNGPEGRAGHTDNGSTGGLRGRKRSLFEGGIRVPAFVTWPRGELATGRVDFPCSTSDLLPTVLTACGRPELIPKRPLDGENVFGPWSGAVPKQSRALFFQYKDQYALIDGSTKWVQQGERSPVVFDLSQDLGERRNLGAADSTRGQVLSARHRAWRESCQLSVSGADYVGGPGGAPEPRHGGAWRDAARALGAEFQEQRPKLVILGGEQVRQLDRGEPPKGWFLAALEGDGPRQALWHLDQGLMRGHAPRQVVILKPNSGPLAESPAEDPEARHLPQDEASSWSTTDVLRLAERIRRDCPEAEIFVGLEGNDSLNPESPRSPGSSPQWQQEWGDLPILRLPERPQAAAALTPEEAASWLECLAAGTQG